MFEEIISIDKLPTLDLHGECKDIAIIRINDFIKENIKLKNKYIVIIHGKGQGIIRKATYEILKNNNLVLEYKLFIFNEGTTVVKLNTL